MIAALITITGANFGHWPSSWCVSLFSSAVGGAGGGRRGRLKDRQKCEKLQVKFCLFNLNTCNFICPGKWLNFGGKDDPNYEFRIFAQITLSELAVVERDFHIRDGR